MKQQIKAMLSENRGVSPVIGVILMVAITVILAAVIGTFVLGLGDSLEQAPQAQLDAEVTEDSSGNEQLEISHNGGDALPLSEISVSVGDTSPSSDLSTYLSGSPDEFTVGSMMTISVGDFGSHPTNEVSVQIIHGPSESIILDTQVTFDSTSP